MRVSNQSVEGVCLGLFFGGCVYFFIFKSRNFETSDLMIILTFLRNRDTHEYRKYISASKFVDDVKEQFGKDSTALRIH